MMKLVTNWRTTLGAVIYLLAVGLERVYPEHQVLADLGKAFAVGWLGYNAADASAPPPPSPLGPQKSTPKW